MLNDYSYEIRLLNLQVDPSNRLLHFIRKIDYNNIIYKRRLCNSHKENKKYIIYPLRYLRFVPPLVKLIILLIIIVPIGSKKIKLQLVSRTINKKILNYEFA